MAHIEDRWYRTVVGPDGKKKQIPKPNYGKGMRYRVRFIGPDGREDSASFPDRKKREAQDFLVTVETDKLRGSYVDPARGRMKFAVFAEQWLRTASFRESTRESAEFRVRKHVLPFFGGRPLASIKPGDIREWDRSLVGKLAVATRSVTFAYLRMILSAAVDDERIVKNPCSARSVTQPRPPMRRVVPWTLDQVSAIRAGLAERYRPMVDFGGGCGLRQGEAFGLGEDDLDFTGGWVNVRRQVKLVRNRLVFGLPKNDTERSIPLPTSVAERLMTHMGEYKPIAVTLPWEEPAGELVTVRLVFTTTRRGAHKRGTFNKMSWHPALMAAGIIPTRETGMHALRHFYASVLLDAGESIKALAAYLGHTDPAFTLRVYTHLMPASEDRTRQAIDSLFVSET